MPAHQNAPLIFLLERALADVGRGRTYSPAEALAVLARRRSRDERPPR